jgi:hypothetical protein
VASVDLDYTPDIRGTQLPLVEMALDLVAWLEHIQALSRVEQMGQLSRHWRVHMAHCSGTLEHKLDAVAAVAEEHVGYEPVMQKSQARLRLAQIAKDVVELVRIEVGIENKDLMAHGLVMLMDASTFAAVVAVVVGMGMLDVETKRRLALRERMHYHTTVEEAPVLVQLLDG